MTHVVEDDQWAHPYAMGGLGSAPLARGGSADADEFVHIHQQMSNFTFQGKDKSPPPADHDRSQSYIHSRPLHNHFHTFGGRLRSASGTDMDHHDKDRHHRLGRMSSLHGWRTSVRRSVANLATNYHNRYDRSDSKHDGKDEKRLQRHGSSPGEHRAANPLIVPRSNSVHATPLHHRPPPGYRNYSSGQNSINAAGPSAPPLCRSPSSAMSTVSSDASEYAEVFSVARTAQRATKSTNNLAETLGRSDRAHSKAKRELLGASSSFNLPLSPRFVTPNIEQVIPWSVSPFAAWDPTTTDEDVFAAPTPKRTVPRKGSVASASTVGSSWYEPSRRRGAPGARRTWRTESGKEIRSTYPVGWERSVLDLEARLHETMYEVAGGQHTFIDVDEDEAPSTVLDLGTGAGLWAISQALAWRGTQFVAADLVPCQTDVAALADAEDQARTSISGTATGKGQWASVADRIAFQQFDFLNGLPYDSGVFDMVHMRFLGLGVPKHRWGELLDEAIRVLKPGGVLEIVEMSYELPPTAHPRIRKLYTQRLVDANIPFNPIFALQLYLPTTAGIAPSSTRPVFSANWDQQSDAASGDGVPSLFPSDGAPPDALADAAMTWTRSALDYKDLQCGNEGGRALRALTAVDPLRWGATTAEKGDPDTPKTPSTPGVPLTPGLVDKPSSGKVALAAWVVIKLST